MLVTFTGLRVVVDAPTPQDAYTTLTNALFSSAPAIVEWTSDEYTVGDEDPRDAAELFEPF